MKYNSEKYGKMKKYLLFILVILLFSGCKTQHSNREKIVTRIDSTAVVILERELLNLVNENLDLRISIDKIRSENSMLSSVIEKHIIDYDILGKINEETGKYPISREEKSINTSVLQKEIKEKETLLQEAKIEIRNITSQNSLLKSETSFLKNENKDLKSKLTTDAFSLKWFVYGLLAGIVIAILIYLFIRIKF